MFTNTQKLIDVNKNNIYNLIIATRFDVLSVVITNELVLVLRPMYSSSVNFYLFIFVWRADVII